MQIELKEVTIRELVDGFADNNEQGVVGYGGRLDIRPPYQREFIYKDKQRDAVIETVINNYPLNVMYWAVREDGTYEVIDGQQRTISICQYVHCYFSYLFKQFNNLLEDEQKPILDYPLMVYVCSGTPSERLKWFETINIAGEKLTKQELRNAVYSGAWVSDAKRYFSKNGCAAYQIANKYVVGTANRQEILERAIEWISEGQIEHYMSLHQHDPNANALWSYFQGVINWVTLTFPKYRKEMKGLDWGGLHREFGNVMYDTDALEQEVATLMLDDEVENKKGIYPYVLTRKKKYLNLRAFSESMKRETYERQGGICKHCKKPFDIEFMEGDHITPWHEGGRTVAENCQMLCRECNRRKGGR